MLPGHGRRAGGALLLPLPGEDYSSPVAGVDHSPGGTGRPRRERSSPRPTSRDAHRAALTVATAALGSHALPLVGGSAYGDALGGATWLFACLGTLLAVAQLLLYSGIAASDRVAVGTVWAAAVMEAAVVQVLSATGRLSVVSIAVSAVLCASLLVGLGLLRSRRGRPVPPEE